MTVITRGDRELALTFDEFPRLAHDKLTERITSLVDELEDRARDAAPVKTGQLRSEIRGRVFSDNPQRIAGYVGVLGSDSNDYAKAGALEYGVDKPRRLVARADRGRQRLVERATRTMHLRAYRYLRDSIEGMRGDVEAQLSEALDEAASEANG